MQELNYELLARCLKYEKHKIRGKKATVGEMFREERYLLRRLPLYVFETAKCMNVRVNAFSTVRFKTNTYSVPVKYVGYEVSVKGYPETVEIYYKGELISTHTRLIGKNLFSLSAGSLHASAQTATESNFRCCSGKTEHSAGSSGRTEITEEA